MDNTTHSRDVYFSTPLSRYAQINAVITVFSAGIFSSTECTSDLLLGLSLPPPFAPLLTLTDSAMQHLRLETPVFQQHAPRYVKYIMNLINLVFAGTEPSLQEQNQLCRNRTASTIVCLFICFVE